MSIYSNFALNMFNILSPIIQKFENISSMNDLKEMTKLTNECTIFAHTFRATYLNKIHTGNHWNLAFSEKLISVLWNIYVRNPILIAKATRNNRK